MKLIAVFALAFSVSIPLAPALATPIDDEPLPNETELFSVNAHLTNFSRSDETKVRKAFELINAVIRTKTFRTRVLEHTWKGKKQFADNRGMTNEQIYQAFLAGAET